MKKYVIAAVVAAGLLAGGLAYASIPDASGTIRGCYSNAQGGTLRYVRVIDVEAGQTCRSDEVALNWNQTGPQGPAGADGVSGYEVVSATRTIANADSTGNPTGTGNNPYVFGEGTNMYEDEILCPPGKVPVSGGIAIRGSGVLNDNGIVSSYASDLNPDYAPHGWIVKWHSHPLSAAEEAYTISAICVSAS